jgi:hypothetical protein
MGGKFWSAENAIWNNRKRIEKTERAEKHPLRMRKFAYEFGSM